MKTTGILVIFLLVLTGVIGAQECTIYFPDNVGTQLVYKHYDKKGKESSKTKQKVTSVNATSNGVEIEIETEVYDNKEELLHSGSMVVRCEGNTFYFDMRNYLDPNTMAGFENMDIKMESENLEFPSNLSEGDMLKDAWIKIEISNAGFKIMTMTVNITDRKVESIETITTPAGSFKCFKITQTVSTKAGIKAISNTSEWYSEKIGLVKSESYNSNGKFQGSSELVEIVK